MTVRTLEVPLKGFGAGATGAKVEVALLDPGDRVRRAATAFGVFFVVAVVAIPIPIVHFVLVPSALLLGIGLGASRLRQREVFRQVSGRCPFCGTEQAFPVLGSFRLPKKLHCGTCRRELELTS